MWYNVDTMANKNGPDAAFDEALNLLLDLQRDGSAVNQLAQENAEALFRGALDSVRRDELCDELLKLAERIEDCATDLLMVNVE